MYSETVVMIVLLSGITIGLMAGVVLMVIQPNYFEKENYKNDDES